LLLQPLLSQLLSYEAPWVCLEEAQQAALHHKALFFHSARLPAGARVQYKLQSSGRDLFSKTLTLISCIKADTYCAILGAGLGATVCIGNALTEEKHNRAQSAALCPSFIHHIKGFLGESSYDQSLAPSRSSGPAQCNAAFRRTTQ
ncbi:hypothetical protein KUCAC02_024037, partial [Chaenocephalus aceratus]